MEDAQRNSKECAKEHEPKQSETASEDFSEACTDGRVILGLHRKNDGKENRSYYNGLYRDYRAYMGFL